MSRLISHYEAPPSSHPELLTQHGFAPAQKKQSPQGSPEAKIYLDLILKMIPAEVVTLYTFAIKLVPLISTPNGSGTASTTAHDTSNLQWWVTWALFAISLILTPLALALQEPRPEDPKWINAWRWRLGLATFAFPLWAYATTGESLPGIPYNNALALIVVAIFAVIAGIIARMVAPK